MSDDKKKEDGKKEDRKETIKDRHDKIQTAILMQINNLLIDIEDEMSELREELSHKADKPGYHKVDEDNQIARQKTGFDKEADNLYDVTNTITTALPSDPGDFENPAYNRERIYEVLGRYADSITIANRGSDNLFVRVSHGGTIAFSREAQIFPGDTKIYYHVYELRLRSPTVGLTYQVSEYYIDLICCPTSGTTIIPVDTTTLYDQLIDEVDANTTYQCLAKPGTLTSAAKWRIRKISKVATVTIITWADGNTEFDNIADNRLTLSYS